MKSLGSLNFNTKLSSAGLVYLHMGKEVLAEVTETTIDDPSLPRLYEKVYEKFIEEIDAIDNGIDQYDGIARYESVVFLFGIFPYQGMNYLISCFIIILLDAA